MGTLVYARAVSIHVHFEWQEDTVVQHYACKTIECVTAVSEQHGKRFLTASAQSASGATSAHSSDVIGPMLWTVTQRATTETLKHSALSVSICSGAVCRFTGVSCETSYHRNFCLKFHSKASRFRWLFLSLFVWIPVKWKNSVNHDFSRDPISGVTDGGAGGEQPPLAS